MLLIPQRISEGLKRKPRVSLFIGPKSVGKTTTALATASEWGVDGSDLLVQRKFTADHARALVRFADVAPAGRFKLALVNITDARPQVNHMILKALEESWDSVRFILISDKMPIETIVSRAELFEFPLLTDAQVQEILVGRGMGEAQAERFSKYASGQMFRALRAFDGNSIKQGVLQVLRAFRENDPALLDRVAASWTEEHTDLLIEWAYEQTSGSWKIFNADESGIEGKSLAIKILVALSQDIRPRLVVRSALMGVLKGN